MQFRHFVSLLFVVVFSSHARLAAQTPVWSQFPASPGGTTRHDDVYFVDPANGWSARGTAGIYRTSDGGQTWARVYTNLTSTAHFRSVGFASTTRGWAGNLGPGSYDGSVNDTNMLYETFDGGASWSVVPGINETGIKGFCALHVMDAQHIYGVGRVRGPAYFARTEDGGGSWFVTNLTAGGVMGGLMDVYFKDTTNGFIVGMDTNTFAANCSSPYYGAIARTTNGGLSWSVVASTPVSCSYFWKMSWPTPDVGYATLQQNGSHGTVIYYKTTDGGATWSSNGIPFSAIGSSSFFLQGVGFVNENEGWMGGSSTLSPPFSFIHTTNGGLTWTAEGYSNTRSINRIRFLTPTLGFMSGQTLHVYRIPLAILAQPTNQIVPAGSNAMFSVTAAGTAPLAYQWRFNGTNIAGADSDSYSITNVQPADEGNYSAVVSDYSGSVTSAIAALTIETPSVAPTITTQPENKIVTVGASATFSVGVEGAPPFSYQWRKDGADISGATGASYTRTNAQTADAGGYSVVVTNSVGSVTSAVATLTVNVPVALFQDDFDGYDSPSMVTGTGTTNGYKIVFRSSSSTVDFKATFGFDYSTLSYPANIPPAPHSAGGTTKGLFLTVNKDATAAAAAVNLYPVGQFFSGNFALKFDMWINWANINTSTEHTLFGINHSGDVTNRITQSPSDGLFFAVAGEDDSSPTSPTLRDFAVFRGGGAGAPVLMTTDNTVFGPAPLLGPQFDNNNPGFVAMFPAKTIPGFGTTPAGTAGLGWVSVEVRQVNDGITWLLNDTIVAQYTNTYGYTNGNIMLGYNDHFSSIGDSNNFVVLDNIRVENVTPSPVWIRSSQIEAGDFRLTFATEPYEPYTVLRATSLTPPDWMIYTNLLGDGTTNTVLVPLLPWTQQYFRVTRP